MQSTIAGSIRGHDRLYKAGITDSEECFDCGDTSPTIVHTVWGRQKWEDIRSRYRSAIHAYMDKAMGNNE